MPQVTRESDLAVDEQMKKKDHFSDQSKTGGRSSKTVQDGVVRTNDGALHTRCPIFEDMFAELNSRQATDGQKSQ